MSVSTRDAGARRGSQNGSDDHDRGEQDGQSPRGRTLAEWTSLAISSLLVLGLVGLLTYLHFSQEQSPPAIEVQPLLDEQWQQADFYYLPIEVANRGTKTGEDVRVEVSLTDPQGGEESTSVTIDFLAGTSTHRATLGFRSDPSAGRLEIETVSYRQP